MFKYIICIGLSFCTLGALAQAQQLVGTWQRECQVTERGSLKEILTSNQDQLSFTMIHYEDTLCQEESYRFSWQAYFELEPMEAGGVYPINFVLTAIYVTPMQEETAQRFNQMQFCGLRGWDIHQRKEVSGRICGGNQLGRKGYRAFNRVKALDNHIYVDINASSGDRSERPPVDETALFSKVELYSCLFTLEQKEEDGNYLYLRSHRIDTRVNRYIYTYRLAPFYMETAEQAIGLYPSIGQSSTMGTMMSLRVYRLYGDPREDNYDNPYRNAELIQSSLGLYGDSEDSWVFEGYRLTAQCRSVL